MSLHERKQLRDAVVAQLKAGVASVSNRVYPTRKPPNLEGQLPVINVYTPSDQTDEASANSASRELWRYAQVVIEAYVEAIDNADDAIDAIALEIETAMDADDSLGGTAFWSWGPQEMQTDVEFGDKQYGVLHMVYFVEYHTDLRESDAALNLQDLTLVDTKTSATPAIAAEPDTQPNDKAEDQVTLEPPP
jgi:hypothetical protein